MFWKRKKRVAAGGSDGFDVVTPMEIEEKAETDLRVVKEKSDKLPGLKQVSGAVKTVVDLIVSIFC